MSTAYDISSQDDGQTGERAVIGGIARMNATTPMTIPTVPTVEESVSRERAAVPT